MGQSVQGQQGFAAFRMCARRRLLSASPVLLLLLVFVDSVYSHDFSYRDPLRTESVVLFPTASPLASITGANVSDSIEAAEYEDGGNYAAKETCVSRSFMFQWVPSLTRSCVNRASPLSLGG